MRTVVSEVCNSDVTQQRRTKIRAKQSYFSAVLLHIFQLFPPGSEKSREQHVVKKRSGHFCALPLKMHKLSEKAPVLSSLIMGANRSLFWAWQLWTQGRTEMQRNEVTQMNRFITFISIQNVQHTARFEQQGMYKWLHTGKYAGKGLTSSVNNSWLC